MIECDACGGEVQGSPAVVAHVGSGQDGGGQGLSTVELCKECEVLTDGLTGRGLLVSLLRDKKKDFDMKFKKKEAESGDAK